MVEDEEIEADQLIGGTETEMTESEISRKIVDLVTTSDPVNVMTIGNIEAVVAILIEVADEVETIEGVDVMSVEMAAEMVAMSVEEVAMNPHVDTMTDVDHIMVMMTEPDHHAVAILTNMMIDEETETIDEIVRISPGDSKKF